MGDPSSIELRRALISGGEHSGRDTYIGNSVKGSGHIGPNYGLNEKQTRDLVASLLETIDSDRFTESLRRYFSALKRYVGCSYKFLSSRLPDDMSLDEIYVPLQGRGTGAGTETFNLADALRSALASGRKQILIEGLPGSGKSTLLRQIARHAWEDPALVGLDRRYIALPIRLRSYALAEAIGREDRIWLALDRARDLDIEGSRPPAGFYDAWQKEMGAPWLLLLDGFDEVPEQHREYVLTWLRKLIQDDVTFLVTSRPTQALTAPFRMQISQFEIGSFSTEQQLQLAERWLGPKAIEFEAAFSSFGKGELGATPLILTIAAIVFLQSGRLPNRRSELYRVFVSDIWQETLARSGHDDFGSEDMCELAPKLIPMCLEGIALKMTQSLGQGSELDFTGDIDSITRAMTTLLAGELSLPNTVARVRADRMVRFLGLRSGVFRMSTGQGEWLHPTFREFLAAEGVAENGDRQTISDILDKFTEDAWRQVALFLIAILSEHESVVRELRRIKPQSHPLGLAFVGVAIAEGANVPAEFTAEVVRDLCADVVANAGPGICERLLTAGDGGRHARSALIPFMRASEHTEIVGAMAQGLTDLAVKYGRAGSSAVHDLFELQALDALLLITSDPMAHLTLRAEIAEQLCSTSRSDAGALALRTLLSEMTASSAEWTQLISILSKSTDAKLLASFSEQGLVMGRRWCELLDALNADARPRLLSELEADPGIPPKEKLFVKVRRIVDPDEVIEALSCSSFPPEVWKPLLDVLEKSADASAMLRVATEPGFAASLHLRALRSLKVMKACAELVAIVVRPGLPLGLRYRAALAAYGMPLDSQAATQLLGFFDSLGPHSLRPNTLARRGFLNYLLNSFEESVDLFDRLFSARAGTSWELGVRAHALEHIGRTDDAVAGYTLANQRDPHNSFARCRLAYILWTQGNCDAAAQQIDAAGFSAFSGLDWFRPYGGDILRQVGRLNDAETWLNNVLRHEPEHVDALTYRGRVAFDKGEFGSAIDYLRRAVDLSPTFRYARIQLARVLRTADRFADSAIAFAELAAEAPGTLEYMSSRAEALLRTGSFGEADSLIAGLRSEQPDEVFYLYLETLSKCFQGHRCAFRESPYEALRHIPDGDGSSGPQLSNKALFLFAIGEPTAANVLLDRIVSGGLHDQLRFYTVPFLDSLAHAIPDSSAAKEAAQRLANQLWPHGYGVDIKSNEWRTALLQIKRGSYAFPMYCQKYSIGGLHDDAILGRKIIEIDRSEIKTILLWTLGRPDRVHGTCNFKKDPDAENDFKFCDATDLILNENLRLFVRGFGVRRLLLLEPDLLLRFKGATLDAGLPIQCGLAEAPQFV